MDHDDSGRHAHFPFQELSITCPEITWDSPFDHVLLSDRDLEESANDDDLVCKGKSPADQKKVMHRDIERQRRQEMSALYASLRSVLPAEVLKGKRSISDQIQEATKYIKHLESGIRDLGSKRDLGYFTRDTERLPEPPQAVERGGCSRTGAGAALVAVESCAVGVEVLINGGGSGDLGTGFPVSKVLQMLLQEGLNVVTCNYTKFDGKSCYMIQSEVRGGYSGIDLPMLRRKLVALVDKLIDMQP